MDDVTPQDEYAAEATRLLDEDPDFRKMMADFASEHAKAQAGMQQAATVPDKGITPYNPYTNALPMPPGNGGDVAPDTAKPWNGMPDPFSKEAMDAEEAKSNDGSVLGTIGHAMDTVSHVVDKTQASITRGALRAGYQMENTLVDAGVSASVKTGGYKMGRSPEEQKAFLDWYAKPASEWTADIGGVPVMPSKATMEDFLPPKEGGLYGFVEGAAQFATGMMATRSSLKAWKSVGGGVGSAVNALDNTRLMRGGLAGVATDMTAFDPHDARLSSMVKDGPDWFGKSALQYITAPLAPHEGDGDIKARLRAGLEGYLTGQTMEGVMWGLSRLRIKNLLGSGAIDEGAAKAEMAKLHEEGPAAPAADGPAKVVKGDDGFHKVVIDHDLAARYKASGENVDSAMQATRDAEAKYGKGSPESVAAEEALRSANTAHNNFGSDAHPNGSVPESDHFLHNPEALPNRSPAGVAVHGEEFTPTPTPTPHDLAATTENTPRPLDFEHTKVATPADIKPDVLTVGAGADGKPVVRAIENGAEGTPPKVFESDFNPETIKQLRAQNPDVGLHTPMRDNGMTKEQWAAWQENAFPKGKTTSTTIGEDLTGADTPNAKAKKQQVVAQSVYPGKAEAQAAHINHISKNVKGAGDILVDEPQRKAFREALESYRKSGDFGSAADVLAQQGFNPSYLQEPKDVINTIKAVVDTMPFASHAMRDVGVTHESIQDAAVKLLPQMVDTGVLNHAAEMLGGLHDLPAKLTALRLWFVHQGRAVQKLTTMVDADPSNAALVDQQMAAMDTLFKTHAMVSGSTTKIAQALGSMRMSGVSELASKVAAAERAAGAGAAEGADAAAPKAAPSIPERLANAMKKGEATHRAPGTYDVSAGMSREEVQAIGRSIGLAGDNVEGMLKILGGPRAGDLGASSAVSAPVKKSWMDFVNTYRAEALLSSPSTHIGNVLSNLGVAVKAPLLRVWAGAESGDKQLVQEGFDTLGGLALHWHESLKAAATSFKTGANMFDASTKIADAGAGSLLPLEWSAMKNGSLPGNLGSALFRMPSRMLMTADEFFKHLNGRAYTRAQVLKQARIDGVTDSAALADRINGAMKIGFDPSRGAIFPDAVKYARVNTFTDDLPKVMQGWQKAIHNTGIGRMVLPFFRTPANIFLHSWEEAPGLNMLNKQMVTDLNAGGQKAALARGKADFGSIVWGLGAWMALNGKLTGAGPLDPELRKQWLATNKDGQGNQPYSLVLGDGPSKVQVSYRRGDPFSTALGVMADTVEMSGELDESSKTSLAAGVMSVFSHNVTNKTFMSGLSDFLDAVSNTTPHGTQKFLGNLAGSFVPNLVVRGQTEDVAHEARTIVDNIKNRMVLPGFAPDLEPRRNVFGEKALKAPGWVNRALNPFTVAPSAAPSDAQAQLLAIGKSMPMPDEKWGSLDLTDREKYGPDRLVNGAGKLGQSPYDRMQEMMANPPWGGPPLRAIVEKLLANPEIQKAPDSSASAPGGLKYMLVARPIEAYQNAAKQALLKEYPTLKSDVVKQSHADAAALVGGRDAAEEVLKKYDRMFVVAKRPAPPDMPVEP